MADELKESVGLKENHIEHFRFASRSLFKSYFCYNRQSLIIYNSNLFFLFITKRTRGEANRRDAEKLLSQLYVWLKISELKQSS